MSEINDLFGALVAQNDSLRQRVDLLERLEFVTSGSPTRPPIKAVAGNYTLVLQDGIIVWDTTGGSFTVSLPPASVTVNGEAVHFYIVNAGNRPGTIDPDGSELIQGSSTATLPPRATFHIVSDGTEWWTL